MGRRALQPLPLSGRVHRQPDQFAGRHDVAAGMDVGPWYGGTDHRHLVGGKGEGLVVGGAVQFGEDRMRFDFFVDHSALVAEDAVECRQVVSKIENSSVFRSFIEWVEH